MVNRVEPYVGPRPFGRADESIFYGRDREASELLSLIIAHPVVLIYAQSGAGKTSLLNAKVIPLLEGRQSEVFGSARVSGDLPQDIKSEDVKNIYVFNALLSLQTDSPEPRTISKLTLKQFLESRPHKYREDGIASRRIILFDQFEEIFTTSPERWQDRTDFFDNVGAALESDPRLRVVFAMREEYIASMDPFADILPERLRTRFRLERLREEAALQAVKKPLANTGRSFAPGAAEKLVKNLLRVPIKSVTGTIDISGEYVEPVQLQVVCQSLWQSLPLDVDIIDETYIENYGDVDRALSTYYEDCIMKVVADKGVKEGELRRWFGKILITSDGTRGTVYKDVRATGGLPNDVVEELEDLRLVRPEMRGGAPWYELTHDRFIGPILKSNYDWFNQRDKGVEISKKLEARADEWALTRKEKHDYNLLTGQELIEAAYWIVSPDAEEIGVSNILREFVQASQTVAERERAEKQSQIAGGLRRQRALLAVVLLIAVALAAFAAYAQVEEKRARRQADNAKLSERGNIAKTLSQQRGREFDALVLGIRTLEGKTGDEPSREAIEGLRAAVASVENSIWLRRISTPVETIEFSRDGEYVLTQSRDKICISNAITGELIFTEEIPPGSEWNSIHLSPDGKLIFAAIKSYQGYPTQNNEIQDKETQPAPDKKLKSTLRVWDILSHKILETYGAEIPEVDALSFSENGKLLLIHSPGNKWHVLDAATGKPLATFPPLKGKLILSPEGTRAAAVGGNGFVELYDTLTGTRIAKLAKAGDEDDVIFMKFSEDDAFLVVDIFGYPNSISCWSTKEGKRLFKVLDDEARQATFIPNEMKVALINSASLSLDIELQIYDLNTGLLLEKKSVEMGPIILQSPYAFIQNTSIIGIEFPDISADMSDPERFLALQYRTLRRTEGKNRKSAIISLNFMTGERQNLLPTKQPVRFKYVKATTDLARIVTVAEDDMVQIWETNKPQIDIANLTTPQLKSLACNQIRYQVEFNQVEDLCK